MGERRLVHAMRRRLAGIGLVGLGAGRPRAALGRRQRVRHPLRRGLPARSPASACGTTGSRSNGHASSPSPGSTMRRRSPTTATCSAPRSTPVSSRGSACTTSRCRAGSPTTGGFLVEQNRVDAWARHVDFIAETFGDLVRGWQPVNETNYYPFAAYLGRGWPPGHNSFEECARVSQAMQLATAEAAVRLKQTGAPVASIFGLSGQQTLDDAAGDHSTRRAAR